MIKQPKRVGNAYDGRSSGMTAKAPIWACRSVGRSLPWHGRGPEFKSRHVHSHQHLTQREWNVLHEESVFICFLHWLGTSTGDK